MTTPITSFRRKVEVGLAISLSRFEDPTAGFAKSLPDCEQVRIVFEDDSVVLLPPEDYRKLSRAEQALIRHAPSRLADEP